MEGRGTVAAVAASQNAGRLAAAADVSPAPQPGDAPWYGWLLPVAIAALFFAAIAPTLPLLPYYTGTERISVATALEMRRDGHYLLPTLNGRPRIVKPPLAAWLTAATLTRATLDGI